MCSVEHNLDVIKQADHIIDLGPEGGDGRNGLTSGTPEQVAHAKTLSQVLSCQCFHETD